MFCEKKSIQILISKPGWVFMQDVGVYFKDWIMTYVKIQGYLPYHIKIILLVNYNKRFANIIKQVVTELESFTGGRVLQVDGSM